MTTAFLAAATVPWAITEPWLRKILDISARQNLDVETAREIKKEREEQRAVQALPGNPVEGTRLARERQGVGVLPITGPIFRYADFFSEISGATSVERLAKDFRVLVDSPDIKAIILDIDSPGGTVNGISEFADQIFEARGKKPVVAYVSHMGASAAYWLASSAREIVVDSSALLGSIGVIMAAIDKTGADAIAGIKQIPFVSSISPNKNPDPSKPEEARLIQAIVDGLGDVFLAAVSRNRAVSQAKVLADFGQGSMLVGQAAVTAGLCDRLGSFEALILELAGEADSQTNTRPAGSSARAEEQTPQVVAEAGTTGADAMAPVASEEETDMTLREAIAKMFGGLSAEEKKEAASALLAGEAPDAQGQGATAPPNPPAQSPAVASPAPIQPADNAGSSNAGSSNTSSSEIENLKAEALKEKTRRIAAEAESFVRGEILGGRLLPAEAEAKTAEYVQAAMDDSAAPVAQGKSRVDTLKDAQAARPRHLLTEELLRAAVPDGAVALGENRSTDPLEEARLSAEAYAAKKNAQSRQYSAPGQSSRAVN